MSTVDIKSKIGAQDLNLGPGTFNRITSSGASIQLNRLNATMIPVSYGTANQDMTGVSDIAFTVEDAINVLVDVRAYGAAGDGVTDDTVAIQAAINSISTTSGGIVYFPVGTYLISSSLTFGGDGVTLLGGGIPSGFDSDVVTRITGGGANINLISLSSNLNIRFEGIEFENTGATSGSAILINGGNSGNIYIDRCVFKGVVIGIDVNGDFTHWCIDRSLFINNTTAGMYIRNSVQINSGSVNNTRFEQSTGGHYIALGAVLSHGGVKFYNCVFEATSAAKAVDLGYNALAYSFIGCHFEDNGHGQTTAYDIYFTTNGAAITIEGCNFSNQASGVTTGWGVYCADACWGISIRNNNFPSVTSGYSAIYTHQGSFGPIVVEGNRYHPNAASSMVKLGDQTIRRNDGRWDGPDGYVGSDIYATLTTTNATETTMWQMFYVPDNFACYLIAEVVAVDNAGTNCAAYTRRILTKNVTVSPSSVGTDDTVTIESNAAWNCRWVVSGDSNGSIHLKVTGAASTTIKWVANIKIVFRKWDI